MDAIVLAAGKGSRLEGVMAPYHKPLMVVNGRPIIWTAVHHALQVGANQVTVVVAPENALPISQVLDVEPEWDHKVQLLVQKRPKGPGDALYKALKIAHAGSPTRSKTLVLMGDNVSSFADVQKINQIPDFAVGVQYFSAEEAIRFTRWDYGRRRWVEGEDIDPLNEVDSTGMIACWVGPFVCPSNIMMSALEVLYRGTPAGKEVKIGPAFNYMSDLEPKFINTTTVDIGTPEMAP